jgi:hypothetical protein
MGTSRDREMFIYIYSRIIDIEAKKKSKIGKFPLLVYTTNDLPCDDCLFITKRANCVQVNV